MEYLIAVLILVGVGLVFFGLGRYTGFRQGWAARTEQNLMLERLYEDKARSQPQQLRREGVDRLNEYPVGVESFARR